MSFRLSSLITASILGLALAGTGSAVAGEGGKACGGKKKDETSVSVDRPATSLIAASLHDIRVV